MISVGNKYTGVIESVNGMEIVAVNDNWVSFHFGEYFVEAKVFSEPSEYGINNGRVSKLRIVKNGEDIYTYDRGLGFDNTDDSILNEILRIFPDA